MLIIPYQTKFTARSLPLVTLVLIALNVLVFFGLQARDEKTYEAALAYYAQSELAAVELPRYRAWLAQRSDSESRERLQHLDSPLIAKHPERAVMLIESDDEFLRELRAHRIVRASDPEFAGWREARDRFEAMFERAFTQRFALKSDSGQPWRYLTHQFLHGSVGHLVGNMIVLLLAGPFAEAALGRWRFSAAYLASGVAAGAAFMPFASGLMLGASGAISGAMAMVAVLYGKRRVPVFYSILFYFDTARIPALALLPVWIANEIYQWASEPDSHVAYGAHLGGLVAGAALAWVLRPRDGKKVDRILDEQFADERNAERRSSLVQQAREAAARLDTKRAARLYRELAELNPNNLEYLTSYFNVALLGHDQETLGDAALRLLWLRSNYSPEELRKTFLQMSQPKVLQALPVDEQLRLARRLVRGREDAAALRVLDSLLADDDLRNLYSRQIADCLLGLYTSYSRNGLRQPADHVKARLSRYFPSPATIGGLPPRAEPPPSMRSTEGGPKTLPLDLS